MKKIIKPTAILASTFLVYYFWPVQAKTLLAKLNQNGLATFISIDYNLWKM